MSLARCKRAFDESAAVRSVMLGFAGALLRLSSQTAACNRLHSIEQRCARWLLMAHDRAQTDRMPMTHEFLASMLGVRRAGVTTTAGELQRSGLISYRQGEITIRDREGLEALACECFALDHAQLDRPR
jgi:CRP-like cAMP-binding protein